jgi:hypothetical protein
MQGKFGSALEMKMELEFIQVNLEGRPGTFYHFCPHAPGQNPGFFLDLGIFQK